MALETHDDPDARILASDPNVIAFAMMQDGRAIQVEIAIDAMQAEFGATRLDPLAHFASHRDVIEGTAKQAYARLAEPTDHLRIGADDFAVCGSRTSSADATG